MCCRNHQTLPNTCVWPWFDWEDCDPDIVFRVTQVCGDQTRIIYSESNANVRVNIPTTLNVTLLANNLACCIPTCHDPECPECLKLTWVGCTPASQIGTFGGDLPTFVVTRTREHCLTGHFMVRFRSAVESVGMSII